MVNRADSRILNTQWIVDQLWILERIPDCAFLDGQILGLKQNLDHRSFFSLSRYAMSSSKLFVFANEAHLNSGVRLMIGIVLWYSHQACCLLWTMELTFTSLSLNFYTSVSGCGWGFRFEKKFGGLTELVKKGTDRRICIPPSNDDVWRSDLAWFSDGLGRSRLFSRALN